MIITNVDHYEADPSHPTGLWLSELTHAYDVFAEHAFKQTIVSPAGRNTRFALIERLSGCRDSATVLDVLGELLTGLSQEFTKTITWGQGSEPARHTTFTIDTGIKLYFCDPHSPWQRGANENLNGLIRDYYPKAMQDQLNDRPRQTLDWATPREKLNALINCVTLTA